jgi:hypothetical protein
MRPIRKRAPPRAFHRVTNNLKSNTDETVSKLMEVSAKAGENGQRDATAQIETAPAVWLGLLLLKNESQ